MVFVYAESGYRPFYFKVITRQSKVFSLYYLFVVFVVFGGVFMMIPYLKKTKMYNIAQQLCKDVPKLKDCEYKFYRGMEWLKWYTDEECEDGWIEWSLCRTGYFISLNKEQHLESEFKAVTLSRATTFRLN